MAFDAAAAKALFDALESHASKLNLFARVNTHEPRSSPGSALSCSITLGPVVPDGSKSGLSSVSGTITFLVMIFDPMTQKPLDGIDPAILAAASALLAEYSGNFTLGGLVREIDLFSLRAEPLYVTQEGKQFRVLQITLPVVVDDLWGLSP
jgi:hypothetical protein